MTLQASVFTLLSTDATLLATLTGGVYANQSINREETPLAFDEFGWPKPSVVVKGRDISPLVNARFADNSIVEVWIRTADTVAGYGASDAAMLRVRALLTGWSYTTDTGTGGEVKRQVGDTGPLADTSIAHSTIRTLRFQATSVWSVPN